MNIFTKDLVTKLRCAFCLNSGASNQVTLDKQAPAGEAHDNGKAIAFMCNDHKDFEPKFATQVTNDRVENIRVEDLQPLTQSENKELEDAEHQKGTISDATAAKVAEQIEEAQIEEDLQ